MVMIVESEILETFVYCAAFLVVIGLQKKRRVWSKVLRDAGILCKKGPKEDSLTLGADASLGFEKLTEAKRRH